MTDVMKGAISPRVQRLLVFGKGQSGPTTTYKGKPVELYDSHGRVEPDSAWICLLEGNPGKGSGYLAVPVRRVDASLLMELDRELLEQVAGCLAERFPEEVRRFLSSGAGEETVDEEEAAKALRELFLDCPSVQVRRTGPTSLSFRGLDDGRYSIVMTPDRRTLHLRAGSDGELECVGGQMTVPGLDKLAPYVGEERRQVVRRGEGHFSVDLV